jgi:hypothetical protein
MVQLDSPVFSAPLLMREKVAIGCRDDRLHCLVNTAVPPA